MTTETKFTVGDYKTSGGHDAKVLLVTDAMLVGAIDFGDGFEPASWELSGSDLIQGYSGYDLMPPLRECWRIDGSSIAYNTREEAEERAKDLLADGVPGPFTITKYREVRDDQA